MSITSERVLQFLPAAVIFASIAAGLGVGQFQLGALADQLDDNEESIEKNEEHIENIQRALIRRQGEISLDLERLRLEQKTQSDKLDQVIQLLQEE